MMDKIYCPYCGKKMKLEEALPFSGVYAYVCECGAVSPNECGKKEAYAAALRRPLQKPMALEEFKKNGFAFIELNEEYYSDYVFPAHYIAFGWDHYSVVLTKCNALLEGLFNIDDDENQAWIDNDDYCKSWRCWATKPSDEEGSAAKWE